MKGLKIQALGTEITFCEINKEISLGSVGLLLFCLVEAKPPSIPADGPAMDRRRIQVVRILPLI
jgi:hypothetical protein